MTSPDLSGLSDRIADALRDVRLRLGPNTLVLAEHGPIGLSGFERDDIAAAIAPIVAEALTAARAEGWERGFDDGERDVFEHDRTGWDERPCIPNPYRRPTSAGEDATSARIVCLDCDQHLVAESETSAAGIPTGREDRT